MGGGGMLRLNPSPRFSLLLARSNLCVKSAARHLGRRCRVWVDLNGRRVRVHVTLTHTRTRKRSTHVHAHAHARTCTAPGIDAWYAKLGLVVVDCVALSLLPLMARDSAGHMWIQSVSRALRELARCNVAVLVTNILVAGDTPLCVGVIDTKAKLALGSSWRLVSDMRVILEPQRTTAAAGAGEYTSPPVCLSGLSVVAWLEKSTRMLRGESLVIHRPLAGPPGT
mmetsp:Transcript_31706/g.79205  ORF Transcript_31706/g.79205 Transcript_31706/m.79205 type:complete len:225 (+) Transcript_31706:3-677(+)